MDNKMENREVMVRISGVKKMYKLGQIGTGTLTRDLQSWWARKRGKEDPNTMIGMDQRSNGETFMALNGIDLTVYKGEAVGIIGGNGAGKSTLLKLLSQVTAPTEGEIDLYGRVASMLEVGTGFHGEMTGRENVYLNGAILGMTRAEIDAKMEEIIEFSEVREFIDTPVKRYSSGMYVKLAFSVAAHLDSEILIMDEVLAVGDMAFQKKCLDKMRDAAKKEGRTVLYVSHNMNTIRQLCDRCVVLNQGKVIFEGDVESSIAAYMGSNGNSGGRVELASLKRAPEFAGHPVTMEAFDTDYENAGFPVGSTLQGTLSLKADRDFDKLYVRAIIKTMEGTPVTMSTARQSFSAGKGEEISAQLGIDISKLVPGRYALSFVVYEVNQYGGNSNLDGLKDVYYFEIVPVEGFNNNMEWARQYWGNVYSDPLEIHV